MNIIVVTRRTENGQLYSVLKLTHIRFLVFQQGNGWTVWSKTTIIYKGCAFNRGLTARMCVNEEWKATSWPLNTPLEEFLLEI